MELATAGKRTDEGAERTKAISFESNLGSMLHASDQANALVLRESLKLFMDSLGTNQHVNA
jgi:hypothetical protein